MAKKPLFKQLEESTFDQSGGKSFSDRAPSSRPSMKVRAGDTEEGKWIKRTNEQLKGIYGFSDIDDNKYIAAWERVFENAGLEEGKDFIRKTVNGVDVPYLRNTKENRDKVDKIRKTIIEENAHTLRDIRMEAIRQLKEEGRKATKTNIDDKLEEMKAYATLESNADFIYWREEQGDNSLSKYTDSLRGIKPGTPRFTKIVRKMADAVKKEKEAERKLAQQNLIRTKRKLNINGMR